MVSRRSSLSSRARTVLGSCRSAVPIGKCQQVHRLLDDGEGSAGVSRDSMSVLYLFDMPF